MKTPVKKTKTPAIAQMVERRTVVFSKLLCNVFLRSLVQIRFAGRVLLLFWSFSSLGRASGCYFMWEIPYNFHRKAVGSIPTRTASLSKRLVDTIPLIF